MAVTQAQIEAELLKHIKTNIIDSSVEIDAHTAFQHVGLDSMSIIDLVVFLERKFKIVLKESDLLPENLKSVNSLAACAASSS